VVTQGARQLQRNDDDRLHHHDTARLEAFSDGVFAIAITLLIIEVGVPHPGAGESLAHALREQWPSYFGYAISFLTIGIMWANHHAMFRDIVCMDHWLGVLNLLLLLCIAFIPFPTAVIAEYMRDDENALAAMLTYGFTLTVTAIFFNALWFYAAWDRELIDEHVSDARMRSRTLRYLPGTPLYAAGIGIAFINTCSVGLVGRAGAALLTANAGRLETSDV
jgi:uncharacterized membrane protein